MNKFDSIKTYSYIKGFAMALGFDQTITALSFARQAHKDQLRKDGQPYIIHPMTMCSHAISIGIKDDIILASLLLHDVVEDCNIKLADLPVSDEVKEIVDLLTYNKPNREYYGDDESYNAAVHEHKSEYYRKISENKYACLCKLFDRCHNVSSMADSFSYEKLRDYVKETREYIVPLMRVTKDKWPICSNALFILKYQINAITDSIEISMNKAEDHVKAMYESQA
jgi:GTP pyrophosphokinase